VPEVKVYALSTCPYCHQARAFLDENSVPFEVVEVDKLTGQLREDTVDEVKRLSGGTSFPVIVVGDQVIVGFDRSRLSQLVGVR
jgi:glutaredoxin-like protein NrdH